MKRYQFTGHLWPLPPGVRLPLQLSGEVYLPSEVEPELKRLNDRISQLVAQVHSLKPRRTRKRRTAHEVSARNG